MTDKLYPLYREAFRAVDTNHDGVILPEEYDQVQRFDVDQDRQVTFWEYLTTHNKRQAAAGLAPLFSTQLIDRLKGSYQIVFHEANEVIFPSLPKEAEVFDLIDVAAKLQEMGASEKEASGLIKKMSGIRPSPTYRYLRSDSVSCPGLL
ncbi:MAG: EF-hand domain-containing protein [Deltaproteobacteria bacterium]|nr:EF-hand domain-containing protein [Deltaproteobacteria bacterium]